jgi:EpsG family
MYPYWLILLTFATAALLRGSYIGRSAQLFASQAGPAGPLTTDDRQRDLVYALTALFIIIIIGLRDRVGGDWGNYLRLYNHFAQLDLESTLAEVRNEPGYTFINWMSAQLGAGVWLVNLICAIPFAYGLVRLSRLQPNPWLVLVVSTPFVLTVVGMGYTRQAAALGCFMIGIAAFLEKRPVKHLIWWTIAGAVFHRSVLAFLPVLLLTTTRNRFLAWTMVILGLVVARFTLLSVALDPYSIGYVEQEYKAAGAFVRVMMNVIPALFVVLFPQRFLWTEEEKQVWRPFAYMSLAAGAALMVISSNVIVDRLAVYLVPIQLFVYARIGYAFGLVRRGWLLWTWLVVAYAAAALFVWLQWGVNSMGWIPYRNYLIPTAVDTAPY